MLLLYGIILGIILSLFFNFGPSFFSLLQTSVHYGFRRSVPFTYGVSLSDILMVVLLVTVLSGIDMNALLHNMYVATIGGAVLSTFGIYTFNRQAQNANETGDVIKFRSSDNPSWYNVTIRGFLINFFNPLIWFYWVSVISVISGYSDIDTKDGRLLIFYIGILTAALGCDVIKCRLASLLQNVLTAKIINIINKISGLILIVFAAYMVVSMVQYQIHPKEQERNSTVFIQRFMETADSNRFKLPDSTTTLFRHKE